MDKTWGFKVAQAIADRGKKEKGAGMTQDQRRASMKVIKDEPATTKRLRRVTVELHHHDEMLMSFRPESYYKLGYPIEDVIYGDIIINSEMVYWCSIGQRWEA